MQKAPKLIYLLRKSKQSEDTAIPVLKRDDFPLRFYHGGKEIVIEATGRGRLKLHATTIRLTGAIDDQA